MFLYCSKVNTIYCQISEISVVHLSFLEYRNYKYNTALLYILTLQTSAINMIYKYKYINIPEINLYCNL